MVEMQVVIAQANPPQGPEDPSGFEQHRKTRVVETIDGLGEVWDTVVERLSALATATSGAAARSAFQLDEIQFNLGIEAGVAVGLVTKANASVSLTFTRREPQIKSPEPSTSSGGELSLTTS